MRRLANRAELRPHFLLIAVLVGLFASCGHAPPEAPGTITFLIETTPANLDPRIGTDARSAQLSSLLFSGLLERDATMNVRGDLADRWEAPDPKTYVFHLHSGVKFSDGRPLTSSDVKFTFQSIMNGIPGATGTNQSPKRGAFRAVQSIDAPDAQTVIFHLSEPNASFAWSLVRSAVGIVPAGSGSDFAQHPVGSGPFRFVSSLQDEEIIFERNNQYFRGPSQIGRVRFRVVPEAVVRALELRKGTADLELNSFTPDMVPVLAKQSDLAVSEEPGTLFSYISFNCEDPALARREVRQALTYATDRATLARTLMRNQARVAVGPLPPNNWAYEPNVPQYEFDPAKAESLLDQAGFPRRGDPHTGTRFTITMKSSTDPLARLLGEVLQDEWKRIGVDLELRPLEFATFYTDITKGNFQLYTLRWVGANNDPDFFEYAFGSHKIPPAGANRGRYRNAQLDALVDQARVEPDREKRRALYSQVQQIISTDLPYLPLWFQDNISVHRRRIENILLGPGGDYDFVAGAVAK
jgi:peptide/nickel transport system substrate-binding protein